MTDPDVSGRGGYDSFVAATLPDLVRFARSLTGDDAETWDLTQDGLVKLYAAWPRVQVDSDPAAYTRTILIRVNLNRRRKLGREAAALLRVRGANATAADSGNVYTPLEPWVAAASRKLSPHQRTAVSLVHLWGWSIPDAAEHIGCRPNTVKTHLARGMSGLRASFHEIQVIEEDEGAGNRA